MQICCWSTNIGFYNLHLSSFIALDWGCVCFFICFLQSLFFFRTESDSVQPLTSCFACDWSAVSISYTKSSWDDPWRCWCTRTEQRRRGPVLPPGSPRCSGCAAPSSEPPPQCLRFPERGCKIRHLSKNPVLFSHFPNSRSGNLHRFFVIKPLKCSTVKSVTKAQVEKNH